MGSNTTADQQFSDIDLGSIPVRAAGFNRVMTLSKLCTYTALANQAIHPFLVGKLVQAICQG